MVFESFRDNEKYYFEGENVCERHNHYALEFLYVEKGKKKVFFDGKEYDMRAGEYTLCPPLCVHQYLAGEGENSLVICCPVAYIGDFLEYSKTHAYTRRVLQDEGGRFLGWMRELKEAKNNFSYQGIIYRMIGEYVERAEGKRKKADYGEKMEKALDYIDEYYNQPFSLGELAKKMGYSRTYFSKLFEKTFHIGFNEYLNRTRIRKSLPLLKKQTISTVYMSVGYNSPQQYFLNFKKIYGVSPKEFLNR